MDCNAKIESNPMKVNQRINLLYFIMWAKILQFSRNLNLKITFY